MVGDAGFRENRDHDKAMGKGKVQDMWLIIIHKITMTKFIPPQIEEIKLLIVFKNARNGNVFF